MDKKIGISAVILAFTAIVLGAFGAHQLKEAIPEASLLAFETGVRYQMYHALLLLFLSGNNMLTVVQKKQVYIFTVIGVCLFSGSIYLLSTKLVTGLNLPFLGPITPVGGLVLLTAWAILLKSFLNLKKS